MGALGFTLVEIALLTVILLVAVGGLSGAVVSAIRLSRATEETALADDAARAMAAQLTLTPIGDVFRTFNPDPGDDLGMSWQRARCELRRPRAHAAP